MGESIKRSVGPYQDSYSPNGIIGEKDACGVGFIANVKGIESNWILKQSLKGLNCMEHRGGCGGDSDSGDGAGILCSIPWEYLEKEINLKNTEDLDKGLESNWILKQSLKGLNCMEHRGGCGGDSDSGDGAGILCSIPWAYFCLLYTSPSPRDLAQSRMPSSA